jgi:hypothetical protein
MGKGLGLVGAFGVRGGAEALENWKASRRADEQLDEMIRARMADDELRRQQLEQQRKYQEEQTAGLREQREANAELRRQNLADKLSEDLTPGDTIDGTQRGILAGAGRGSLIEHQSATLLCLLKTRSWSIPTSCSFGQTAQRRVRGPDERAHGTLKRSR